MNQTQKTAATVLAALVLASSSAFAIDLSDNPVNRAAGWLNGILTGVNSSVEHGFQKFDRAVLMVKVEGSGDAFLIEALTGTRKQYTVSRDDVDYVFRAGLAEAATKACGGRDYGLAETSPQSVQAWNKWMTEHSPFDINDQRQLAILREPNMEFSIVWQVRCGETGGWRYPGERAMTMPTAAYVNFLTTKYKGMTPLGARGARVAVHVPTGELIQKTYDLDIRNKKGHMTMFQQRLMVAAAAARLKEGGVEVEVIEYNNPSEVGGKDGLYVTLKPLGFALVKGTSRRDWNPQRKWDEFMSVPLDRYENSVVAFGDAGATFVSLSTF
jgi:hypothetical protein